MIAQASRDVARKGEDARVRVEADAAGGALHVRATAVGDDGHRQSFRRFVVHVAGPEGFAREKALEATGAGAYEVSIPLSRPGTYLTVVRDELSGDSVGTTGAVLTAGEELRPTGGDPALLGRIAELTRGRRRDTLAGIFADRAPRRFAYEDEARPLLLIAAFGLLLTAAARRLTLPDAAVGLPGRLWAKVQARRADRRAALLEAEATLEALLGARARSARAREAVWQRAPAATFPAPGSIQAVVSRVPPVPAVVAAKPGEGAEARSPSSTPLTAAEILLARRARRRGS